MPIFRVFLSAENDTGAHALDWFKNSAKFYRILLFRHEQGWGQLLATSKGLLTFGDDILFTLIYCFPFGITVIDCVTCG